MKPPKSLPKQLKKRKEPKKFPLMDEFYDEFEFEGEIIGALKKEREKQGLSQQDLADKIGIHKSALARFELGRMSNPKLIFLKKIIIGLGLKLTLTVDKSNDRLVI